MACAICGNPPAQQKSQIQYERHMQIGAYRAIKKRAARFLLRAALVSIGIDL
ncbi:hypothetical protein CBM2598_U10252 [Cupriavidus taiwanensis]|uniref:Uncharacterized protein n=1 Tax=Cupriavidus taiwanensis TaxID=164546 RepID=A0A7Z7JHT9_9BURK|nr:hypothetical protein CBM2597_U10098 [Cupriavidus taiwanensis]SOZ96452.1 hypothetical protein CBM2598_U10252 [Cupriavidus taiwanensis]SPC25604.1 hypothetical protein CBM2594_U10105 [Cupriavidus taiwanensis]